MKNDPLETVPRKLDQIGLENFATYLMNRIMARYNAELRRDMAELGLSTPKMRVLAVLNVIDAPLIGELSVHSIIENSTLSRTLDALESSGLVSRSTDAVDSRATRVTITDAGRGTFETIWPAMLKNYDAMFAGIDAAESEAFIATLKKMLRNVRVHDY